MTRKASISQPINSRLVGINRGFQYTFKTCHLKFDQQSVPLNIFQRLTAFEVFDHQHHHSTYHLGLVGEQKRMRCIVQLFRFTPRSADRCQHVKIRWCGRTIIVGRLKTYHLSRFATVAIIFNTSVFQSGLEQYCCISSKSMIWVIMESCLRTSVSQASYVGKALVTKAPLSNVNSPQFFLVLGRGDLNSLGPPVINGSQLRK